MQSARRPARILDGSRLALNPGARLGPYEIASALGAGGMGEVYRARDTKLNRDVALKVLPDFSRRDAERLARFTREAQVLASLNHPNIARDLRPRGIERCACARDGARRGRGLCRIASRKGRFPSTRRCPSRDRSPRRSKRRTSRGSSTAISKPANIKVRADGTVKVLDFGLAKALEPAATAGADVTASPTITSPAMTQAGMILGTAAYMSPEQAKGRPADKRSDVWAFGAVLYEMLSGQRAFKGDDMSDTLAAVLRQNIDLTALPASTPAAVRRLVSRCLDRDVKQRLRDIGEARIALEDPTALTSENADGMEVLAPPAAAVAARDSRRALRDRGRRTQLGPPSGISASSLAAASRDSISVPPAGRTGFVGARLARLIALSPDGAQMVYAANTRLFRPVDVGAGRAVRFKAPKDIKGVTDPVFSPDGHRCFLRVCDRTHQENCQSRAVWPRRFAAPMPRSASAGDQTASSSARAARASCGSHRMAALRTLS